MASWILLPPAVLLQDGGPEDGPNLLVRGVPVVLLACITGMWFALRRRRR